jgi:putative ABC transport system permease protein
VIGVVGDATYGGLDEPQVTPAVFIPYTFYPSPGGWLFARATVDPATAIHTVKARLGDRMVYAESLQWQLETWGWGKQRLMTEILGLYAGVALALAAAGLYGVVSFAVTRRTRELGIRMALGAGRGAVVRLVLGSTAAMVGIGLVAGVILSAVLAPVFSSWGGGSLFTSLNLVGAALIFMIVAAIACGVPVYRAMKVDPMVALRYE